jgi:hypothetical protein
MARTTIVSAASITNSYDDNRVLVRVSPGPLGFLFDVTTGSASTVSVRYEFSDQSAPDVTDDTHWWTPIDEAGSAVNVISGIGDGQFIIDLESRFPGTTAGNITSRGVPQGMIWMRVAVQLSSTDSSTVTVTALHSPGPASSEASVTAS